MPAESAIRQAFQDLFDGPAETIVRSPGRVNLIGEHTDYNDGFVMPLAIEQSLHLAIRPRKDGRVIVRSLDLGTAVDFSLEAVRPGRSGWGEYIKGVAWALQDAGEKPAGWEGVLSSEIPIGAGLSSSAALEMGAAMAFQSVSSFPWDPVRMARLGQRAENEWIGVNSGIMDQLIIGLAEPGSALKIDCRSLETRAVPLPEGVRIVVIDSATRRGESGLADSAYNDRRGECEEAARWFGLRSLRDLSPDWLEAEGPRMPPVLFRRARHVLSENRRVLAGEAAMRRGDGEALGAILQQGHASQRDDFETSRPEIDALVRIANAHPACFGARLTGGGFGGCVVGLVREDGEGAFGTDVAAGYLAETGLEPVIYATMPAGPVQIL